MLLLHKTIFIQVQIILDYNYNINFIKRKLLDVPDSAIISRYQIGGASNKPEGKMLINKVQGSTNKRSIREVVDGFDKSRLYLPALQMKVEETYWKLNYRELQYYIKSIGNALLQMGIKKGDKIGVISENRVEWAVTYLAVTCFGAVIVPFDILLNPEELLHIVKASDVIMVFTSSAYIEKIAEIQSHIKTLKQIVSFDENKFLFNEIDRILKIKNDQTSEGTFKERIKELENEEFKEGKPLKKLEFIYFNTIFNLGKSLFQKDIDNYSNTIVDPYDTAALIFTSGTTGMPKGVMLNHYNLITNADGLHMGTYLGPGDNWIIVLPYHHTYPTILGVILPILTYGLITTIPTLRPNILIQTMKETGATCIPAVPVLIEKIYKNIFINVREKGIIIDTIFSLLFNISKFFYKVLGMKIGHILFGSVRRELGVPNLKFFISGAGPIPKEVIDGMEILGLTIMQGYGLTESSPVISTTFPEHNKPGSVGLPLCNVEVRIVNPDDEGNGELLVRGPNIMTGYYKQPDLTDEVIDGEGWLHTGDIARRDEEGYIFISGRMKNIIVTKGGKNIYPEEIENKLLESDFISEVVVIPETEDDSGEFPYAIIYPNFEAITALENQQNKTFNEKEIKALIKNEIKTHTSKMANYKLPRGFEITNEELPKTSSKKVKRFMFKINPK